MSSIAVNEAVLNSLDNLSEDVIVLKQILEGDQLNSRNNVLKLDLYMENYGEDVEYAYNPERCRVIMLNPEGDCVAFIKRTKNGKVHYTLPGGGREEGEMCIDTIKREIDEELNLKRREYRINSKRVLVEEGVYNRDRKGERYRYWIYTAKALSDQIEINGEEVDRDKEVYGEYEAVWVPIANLADLNTKYTCVKDMFCL